MESNYQLRLVCLLLAMFTHFHLLSQNSGWQLIYEHSAQGELIKGSKKDLIDAVRMGKEVRVGWKMGSSEQYVEHFAEAQFLTIMNGEVFGQITPILSQKTNQQEKKIGFREGLKWSFIASTTGVNATMFYSFTDATVLDKSSYQWGNQWFVKN